MWAAVVVILVKVVRVRVNKSDTTRGPMFGVSVLLIDEQMQSFTWLIVDEQRPV